MSRFWSVRSLFHQSSALTALKTTQTKITIMSRDLRTTKRLAMHTYLEEVNIKSMIDSSDSCEDKVKTLENIVNTGTNILLPLKKKIIHPSEPEWVNRRLKFLISKRQKALAQGDHENYCALQNQVNRERKSCLAKFYDSKVEHLKKSKPATWWSEVKKLCGMSTSKDSDPTSLYQHIDCAQPTSSQRMNDITNFINSAFLSVMNDFKPLQPNATEELPIEAPPIRVSALSVFKKLSSLNPSKATFNIDRKMVNSVIFLEKSI